MHAFATAVMSNFLARLSQHQLRSRLAVLPVPVDTIPANDQPEQSTGLEGESSEVTPSTTLLCSTHVLGLWGVP